MSQFIKFYFTSSMLNLFRTLIHPSSGACDFSIVSPHWSVFLFLCVLEYRFGWVRVVSVQQASACYTNTTLTQPNRYSNTHRNKNTDQCGDTIEKSQTPDEGCINVRNKLSIEEVKQKLITSDIKLVSYSSTITMMHGPIYIIFHKNFVLYSKISLIYHIGYILNKCFAYCVSY